MTEKQHVCITQGLLIERVLRERKRGAYLETAPTLLPSGETKNLPAYNLTPSSVRYRVIINNAQSIDTLFKDFEDAQAHIHSWRMNKKLLEFDPLTGDTPQTRLRFDKQNKSLTIDRLNREILHFDELGFKPIETDHICAVLGTDLNTVDQKISLWVPSHEAQPHALVVGTTGSGKTTLLQTIIHSLATSYHPSRVEIRIADMKRSRELRQLCDVPHVTEYAREPQEALFMLNDLFKLMEEREKSDTPPTQHIVVVIDEISSLVGKIFSSHKDVIKLLAELMKRSRESLIHFVFGTQQANKETLGDSSILGNIPVKICGLVPSADAAYQATKVNGTNAHQQPGSGTFIVCRGPSITSIQSPFISADEVVTRSNELYSRITPFNDRSKQKTQQPNAPQNKTQPTTNNTSEIPWNFLQQHDKDTLIIWHSLGHAEPSKADMIRWICLDPNANTGGSNRQRMLEALDNAKNNQRPNSTIPSEIVAQLTKMGWIDYKEILTSSASSGEQNSEEKHNAENKTQPKPQNNNEKVVAPTPVVATTTTNQTPPKYPQTHPHNNSSSSSSSDYQIWM